MGKFGLYRNTKCKQCKREYKLPVVRSTINFDMDSLINYRGYYFCIKYNCLKLYKKENNKYKF